MNIKLKDRIEGQLYKYIYDIWLNDYIEYFKDNEYYHIKQNKNTLEYSYGGRGRTGRVVGVCSILTPQDIAQFLILMDENNIKHSYDNTKQIFDEIL